MQDQQTHAIIGAAMEVHRQLGHGFLEAVCQEALALELSDNDIPFRREVNLPIHYKGQLLACAYRADFLCYDRVVVELKALSQLTTAHHAQVINELKATGYTLGLLLNFGAQSLEYRRFVRSKPTVLSADYADFRRLNEDAGEYQIFTE